MHVCVYVHVCIYVYTYTHTYVCICICMYISSRPTNPPSVSWWWQPFRNAGPIKGSFAEGLWDRNDSMHFYRSTFDVQFPAWLIVRLYAGYMMTSIYGGWFGQRPDCDHARFGWGRPSRLICSQVRKDRYAEISAWPSKAIALTEACFKDTCPWFR